MEKRYTITINLVTDDPNYTGWCGKQNLIDAITERFGCSESDIEVEEDDVEDNMEDNEH